MVSLLVGIIAFALLFFVTGIVLFAFYKWPLAGDLFLVTVAMVPAWYLGRIILELLA